MSTLSESYFPPPRSWDAFEGMAFDVFTLRLQNPHLKRYGRSGQAQRGVDIVGPLGEGRFLGIQCKNHPGLFLPVQVINEEVRKAESFSPSLSHYILATSAPRSVAATSHVISVSDRRKQSGQFTVEVFFWEDICHEMSRHPQLVRNHFPELCGPPALTQPVLEVTFSNGESSADAAADWEERPPIQHEKVKQSVGRDGRRTTMFMPPMFWYTPAKIAGTTPLRFRVKNHSPVEAKEVRVTIFLPESCHPVTVNTSEIFYPTEKTKAIKKKMDRIEVEIERLLHRPAYITRDVHLAFPKPGVTYELPWVAHAGNTLDEYRGTLQLNLLNWDVPPTRRPTDVQGA